MNEIIYIGEVPLELVWVPAGEFRMGSDMYACERPLHRVTMDGFYITKTHITQAQWKAVMGTDIEFQRSRAQYDYGLPAVGDNYPMYYVNNDDGEAFADRLGDITGYHFSIPTEAQWEYAAGGGPKRALLLYSGSNDVDEVAWYEDNCGSILHRVGSKHANSLGIYDMSGNMWEFCEDWYDEDFYKHTPDHNPVNKEKSKYRVARGGGWSNNASGCRVAARYYYNCELRVNDLSFRVVRTL